MKEAGTPAIRLNWHAACHLVVICPGCTFSYLRRMVLGLRRILEPEFASFPASSGLFHPGGRGIDAYNSRTQECSWIYVMLTSV
jgi:hypothetical protein